MTKTLNSNSSTKDNQAALEKAKKQEDWFKIVVKVLAWKDGLSGAGMKIEREKITSIEWKHYSDRILKNNVSYNKDRVKQELQETWDKISQYGGFEI